MIVLMDVTVGAGNGGGGRGVNFGLVLWVCLFYLVENSGGGGGDDVFNITIVISHLSSF